MPNHKRAEGDSRSKSQIFLTLLLVFGCATAYGQADSTETRVVIIEQADSLAGLVLNGERIQKLIGRVRLRQDAATLEAQQAIDYLDRNEILFTGRVRIIDTPDTLEADRILYNSRSKIGRATGRVRLADGEAVLRAPSGTYNRGRKQATFTEGVQLSDSTSVLTSLLGTYDTNSKIAVFYDSVRLAQEDLTLAADSIVHRRTEDLTDAYGTVEIEQFEAEPDTASPIERTFLYGTFVQHNKTEGRSRIKGNPLLIQLRTDSTGTDTLLVRARLLEALRTDTLTHITALDSVRVWQTELAATADSMVYTKRAPVDSGQAQPAWLELYRQPVLWFAQTQVSGDTIRMVLKQEALDSLVVRANAFLAQWDSTLARVQQIQGRNLLGQFEADSLRSLLVGPNAEALYFRAEEEDSTLAGAVRLSADQIQMLFASDTLETLKGLTGIEGLYYEKENIPELLQLSGYRWMPEQKPTRTALLGHREK